MRTRKSVLTAIVAFVSAGAIPTAAPGGIVVASREASAIELIQKYRKATWRWQRLMRVPLTPARQPATSRETFRRDAVRLWRQRARRAYRQAHDPPHHAAWLCIHRYEGPWTANTGNGYYGGLQMDMTFQRTYGSELLRRKGAAHRWRPIEQIWVAVRAHRSGRGFHPWPNTARRCGLS